MDVTTQTVDILSKQELVSYFKHNSPYLHLYEIGDLDAFFWPHTRWFGVQDVASRMYLFVVLLYTGGGDSEPVLIALANKDDSCTKRNIQYGIQLLQDIVTHLPGRFHSHLSPELLSPFQDLYQSSDQLKHYKMKYCPTNSNNQELLNSIDTRDVSPLFPSDILEVKRFFADSYPDNWFDPRMLHTKQMFGIYEHHILPQRTADDDDDVSVPDSLFSTATSTSTALVAVAGIHVYSQEFSVAVLGNISVHPSFRCRGLARKVTAALLKSLLTADKSASMSPIGGDNGCSNDSIHNAGSGNPAAMHKAIGLIGLNVDASNVAAIKCYQQLGFEIVSEFYEVMWDKKKEGEESGGGGPRKHDESSKRKRTESRDDDANAGGAVAGGADHRASEDEEVKGRSACSVHVNNNPLTQVKHV